MQLSLDDRQRRELWGLGLLALALLLALSLVPVGLFGPAGMRVFPTGNVVGVAGSWLARATLGFLGAGALGLPVLAALWGLVAFDKLEPSAGLRWSVLAVGLMILVPATAAVAAGRLAAPPLLAGWTGAAAGWGMASLVGTVGASLVLFFAFAGLCVATLRWNPLRTAVGGGRLAWGHARTLATSIPAPTLRIPDARRLLPARKSAPQVVVEEDAEIVAEPEEFLPDDAFASYDEELTVAERPVAVAPVPAKKGKAAAKPVARSTAAEQTELIPEDAGDPTADDLPATGLLTAAPFRDEMRNRQELDKLGQVLIDKLATFKIEGTIVGMTTGPVVTQFEVSPAPGVKVARIANLEADLALALKAPSVRIVAPIPGKGAVGVEVPNPSPEMVFFREVVESSQFRSSKALLPLALGKDIAGRPIVADLAKMPHLLIAGATGSGKSVCVNTIITSLVYRHSPRSLRFLMVDPKMVELSMYNDLPHLRHPVVTDNNDAAAVLKWAVLEMERRYELLSVNGVRNLQDFNKRVESGVVIRSPEADGEEGDPDRWLYKGGALPYIVVIIDELADLMMTVQGDVEKPLALLAQKARAIGIHLILATQRPSVNVITGLIKANFPSRIAFRVSSKVDSRTILDGNGADALLGNGDMLMLPPGSSELTRIQGAYLSTEETEEVMKWYREQARIRREEALAAGLELAEGTGEANILDVVRASEDTGELEPEEAVGERDKLFREAAELCVQHQGGSTSLLQRRLRIGYGRAARIIDQLHFAGVLGPPDGSKPREVLIDFAQIDAICGN